jgi:uncharacterized protein (DUF1330 family)
MSAYVIVDVSIIATEQLGEYRRIAKASIAKHGGRYLALSQTIDVLEADWSPDMIVLLEFPSSAAARAWYDSEDYAPALDISRSHLARKMIIVNAERAERVSA